MQTEKKIFDFPALASALGGSAVAQAFNLISSLELVSKIVQLLILIMTLVYLCHRYWRFLQSGKPEPEKDL